MQPVWTFLADIFTGIGDLLTKWISNLGAGPQLTSDIIAFVAAGVMATVVLLLLVPVTRPHRPKPGWSLGSFPDDSRPAQTTYQRNYPPGWG
jgi:hypothetical protein